MEHRKGGFRDDHDQPWNNGDGPRTMTDLEGLVLELGRLGVTDIGFWGAQSYGSECVKARAHYGVMPVMVYVNHSTAGVFYRVRTGEVCFVHAELEPGIDGLTFTHWKAHINLKALL